MDQNKKYFEANRKLWDKKTGINVLSAMYDLENFLKGQTSLQEIELGVLVNLKGKKVLHLQCHFGLDSMSMARMGAEVTGVDISPQAIAKARQLNDQLGLSCTFIESNVYDCLDLVGRDFDLVYVSYGAIPWLSDLFPWADLIDVALKPGGEVYIVEFHPFLYTLDFDSHELKYDYFYSSEPIHEVPEHSYSDDQAELNLDEYSWNHSIEEILEPFLAKSYQIKRFKEYNYSPYNCFPQMKEMASGRYQMDIATTVPHILELRLIK